jgi:maleylacetate reductase
MSVEMHQKSFSYRYVPPRFPEIHGGANSLAVLPQILNDRSVRKVMLVTSGTFIRRPDFMSRIAELLGGRLTQVFGEVRPHSPIEQVVRALQLFRECGADCVISLGGGSAVDTAKGVAWYADEQQLSPSIVHVAIPSTFSGAEYTTDAGITISGVKKVHSHVRIIPSAVVLDPLVVESTSLELRRSSLANALAHCLEGSVSVAASPMTDAFYLHGIHLLNMASECLDTPDGLLAGQAGAALAALHQVPMGLAHALAHVIGGRYRTPHGATHGVVAAAVMRLNLPVVALRQANIGRALGTVGNMGGIQDAWASIQGVRALLDRLGVPRGLRDLGVSREELPSIAELAANDASYGTNPRPLEGIAGRRSVTQVLEWAWSGEVPPP